MNIIGIKYRHAVTEQIVVIGKPMESNNAWHYADRSSDGTNFKWTTKFGQTVIDGLISGTLEIQNLSILKGRDAVLASRVNRSGFEHKGRTYRLTGYYFVYEVADGKPLWIRCKKEDCTHVSGTSTAGVIADIDEVSWFDGVSASTLPTDWKLAPMDIMNYNFYSKLPQGLTEDQLLDKVIEVIK